MYFFLALISDTSTKEKDKKLFQSGNLDYGSLSDSKGKVILGSSSELLTFCPKIFGVVGTLRSDGDIQNPSAAIEFI